jgi:hypothetical protein
MLAALGLAVGASLGWKPLLARYWLNRYMAGDAAAAHKLTALGPTAVPVVVGYIERNELPGLRQADRYLDIAPGPADYGSGSSSRAAHPEDILGALDEPAERALFAALDRAGTDRERRARLCWALGHVRGEKAGRAHCRAHLDESLELWRFSRSRWAGTQYAALLYLAARQEDDGHWDAARWGAAGASDVEVTSLALLAFLGCGMTGSWRYDWAVRVAQAFLIRAQRSDGCIGSGAGREHLIAALALSESWAMDQRDLALRDAAQRAADFAFRNASEGNVPDAVNAALEVFVATTAGSARLSVPGGLAARVAAIQSAVAGLTVADGPEAGLVRPRPGEAPTPASCAAACTALYLTGANRDDPRCRRLVAEVVRGRAETLSDPLAMWLGTSAAYQTGGQTWKDWSDFAKKSLVPAQNTRGSSFGGWPVASPAERRLGGVGTTALRCMYFDFYRRYPMIHEY